MRSDGATTETLESPRSCPTGGSPSRASTGEYSTRLAALGAFAVRHKTLVIGAWIGVAVILAAVFPQLETVVRQQSIQLLPNDVASFRAVDDMAAAFNERGAKTTVVVAMEDPAGLTPSARQRYDTIVSKLRADRAHVLLVQDLLADPITRTGAVGTDGKAWFLPVGIAGTLGDPKSAASVDAVRKPSHRHSPGLRLPRV